MIKLTSKQIGFLRSLAMTRPAVFRIGKDGLSPALLQAIDDYVRKNELVKVALLGTAGVTADDLAAALAERDIVLVQTIGKNVVLYRPHPERDRGIELPPRS